MKKFSGIEEIIKDVRKGRMVVVVDDEKRENEGDIVLSAKFATPRKINFIIKHAKGLLCAPMSEDRLRRLNLMPMERENSDPFKTDWFISVDYKKGTSTGISAYDRARTLKALASSASPSDFSRPGHVFPLRAKEGGVLVRAGHTEACVDLMKLAGLPPVGAICEIIGDSGKMARLSELGKFARRHGLKIGSIRDLIEYRRRRESMVELVSVARLPTRYGRFRIYAYRDKISGTEHVALVMGEPAAESLVRVHSECLTGDVFHSLRCDCGNQLDGALRIIARNGSGVLLYMRQEGRGIGLLNKIKAYNLQDRGYDTVEANHALGFDADLRDYGIGAQILSSLGIKKLRLITNNPRKIVGLKGYGLEITERIPLLLGHNRENSKYLMAKKKKLGHLI